MNEPILITGAARSGVPIIAAIVQCCGAWGGIPVGEDYDGRRMTENFNIKRFVLSPALNGMRADALGQSILPQTDMCKRISPEIAPAWNRRITRIINKQGYKDGPWFYASPRICLTWPIWKDAFPNAKWIVVRRHDADVISACMKTKFMDAYETEQGWAQWLREYKKRFQEIQQEGIQIYQIWPHRFINGQFSELHKLIIALGLNWDGVRVTDFLAPILWKKGMFNSGGYDGI